MKRMIPPIFMLLLVVVITLATPIDAQVKVDERQPVEPMTTTTVLSTESLPEMSLEAEPETVEVDDGLLTSPSGLAAEDLHLRHILIGLEQVFIDAEVKHGIRADFLAAVAALESGWGAISSDAITSWVSGRWNSQVRKSASTQSQHISPSIISVRTANIITAKPLRVFVSGITEALNGQK